MSPTPAPIGPASVTEAHTEQRAHPRYAITLDLKYKLLRRGRVVQFGPGRMLNISTGGILFETNDALPSSRSIELMIDWPFLFDGVCPIKLVIEAHIVRNEANRIAVSIQRHKFQKVGAHRLQTAS
jgi:hypothetical protein